MDRVLQDVRAVSRRHGVDKAVLFGSRARGDNSPTSDYDIAVLSSSLTAVQQAAFRLDIEDISTLKKIDVVFMDAISSQELQDSIQRDGVTVYDKTGIQDDEPPAGSR